MKKILLLIFCLGLFTPHLHAQKKINLYIQLTSYVDLNNDLNFGLIYPPKPAAKKVKVESLDTLINFDEINEVIKKLDNKGVRVLNELSLLGWTYVFSAPAERSNVVDFGGPRVILILSKEFIIEEKE